MKNSKLLKSFISYIASLVLFFAFSFNIAPAQEIPNGDGDLLWERSLGGCFVNDAKFHPINGNIIAAVNHEIWEIDPKDGHTIRVFEGGPASGQYDQFKTVSITSDGLTVVTGDGSGLDGLLLWDYNTGKVKNIFTTEKPDSYSDNLGIYPDNNRIIYYSVLQTGENYLRKLNIYSISENKIIKEINFGTRNVERMALSQDGKYIALGISDKGSGDWIYSMELWDAETLTKIRDFGADNSIGEFNDVQISSNNQFVAFQGGGHLNLFNLSGDRISLFLNYEYTTFTFSYEGNYTIIGGIKQNNYYQVFVMRNPEVKELYTYSEMINNFRVNRNNEILCGREKIRLYSNNWHTVGIKPQFDTKTTISYENDELIFKFSDNVLLKSFYITDSLGRKVVEQNNLDYQQNGTLQYKVNLIPGLYFITITTDKGTEPAQKLIVNK